eukprot:425751-Hanusia_phi.AAC.2
MEHEKEQEEKEMMGCVVGISWRRSQSHRVDRTVYNILVVSQRSKSRIVFAACDGAEGAENSKLEILRKRRREGGAGAGAGAGYDDLLTFFIAAIRTSTVCLLTERLRNLKAERFPTAEAA